MQMPDFIARFSNAEMGILSLSDKPQLSVIILSVSKLYKVQVFYDKYRTYTKTLHIVKKL